MRPEALDRGRLVTLAEYGYEGSLTKSLCSVYPSTRDFSQIKNKCAMRIYSVLKLYDQPCRIHFSSQEPGIWYVCGGVNVVADVKSLR
jgi:hypothetical protein